MEHKILDATVLCVSRVDKPTNLKIQLHRDSAMCECNL